MNLSSVYMIAGFVFVLLTPVVGGIALYSGSTAVFYLTKRYWKRAYYWLALNVMIFLGVIWLYRTGAYLYFHLYGLRDFYYYAFEKLALWLNFTLGLTGIQSFRLARTMLVSARFSPIVAVLLPFIIKRWGKNRHFFRPKDVTNLFFKSADSLPPGLFDRLRRDSGDALIGINETRKPLFLRAADRGMHMQVVGSTGFGKTASVMMPLLRHDLLQGKGGVIIDGKGDLESFCTLLWLVRACGREKDLEIFSPVYPRASKRWNPLLRGSDIEIKDRIIGAQLHSDEFYKKKSEKILVDLVNVLHQWKEAVSFSKLQCLLDGPNSSFAQGRTFQSTKIERRFKEYLETYRAEAKNLAGISADLNLFTGSHIGELFEAEPGEGIDLVRAYMENKIVYFHLPVLALEETARRIGRMVIHDLKTLVAHVQISKMFGRRHFPVYIDEFASFASENFIELLNKARSSGVSFTLLHQSLGDVDKISPNFSRQLHENTNIKIILRLDDPQSIELFCRMAGTRLTDKMTRQVETGLLGDIESGMASKRDVHEFIIEPNVIRSLRIGEALVMVKTKRIYEKVKLDFIEPRKMTSEEIGFDIRTYQDVDLQSSQRKNADHESTNSGLRKFVKKGDNDE